MLGRLALAPLCALIVFACSSDPSAENPGGEDAGADGSNTSGEDGGPGGDGGTSPDGSTVDPPEVPLVPPKSGTRLKARFDKVAENLLVFRDLYDAQLMTSCQENTTADGKLRCVPPAENGSYYYSDGNCQSRLVGTSPGACLQKYAWAGTDPTGCTGGNGYYQIGAPYVGAVYRKTVNGCIAASSAGTEFYQLGTAYPDTTFAEVAIEYTPIAAYASASVTTSADGLKVWKGGFYDPLNKVTASVKKAGDDKMRVLPFALSTVNQYKGGQTCNIALAAGPIRCGKDPTGLASFQPSLQIGCDPPKTSLYSLGATYNGQLYNPQTQCSPVSKPADTAVFEVGVAVDPGLFAEAVPKTIGDTKISAATYAVGGHSITAQQGTLTDKVLNVSCSIQLAADGTRRCMPVGAANEYFTDAQCTARVFGRYPQYGCGAKMSNYGLAPEAGCAAKVHVHALGASIASPAAVWRKNEKSGACEPSSPTSLQFFAAGAEIPPSSLVEGKPIE